MRYFILIIFFASSSLFAQNRQYHFDYITTHEGLTQSVASKIVQDKNGFIWIGTLEGLNRYDGFEVKNYYYDIHSDNCLVDNYINDLYSDSHGELWIATREGLNLYNHEKEVFHRFIYQESDSFSISCNEVSDILEDRQNQLWFATRNGLNMFNRKDSTFSCYYFDKGPNQFTSLVEFSDEFLWIGTESGILLFDKSAHSFKKFPLPFIDDKKITDFEKQGDLIWIGTKNGLFLYHSQHQSVFSYLSDSDENKRISDNFVYCVFKDNKEQIWVGTDNGIDLFVNRKKTESIKSNGSKANTLLSNSVREIYQDKTGVMWIGTVGGVNKFDPASIKFKHYKTGERHNESKHPDFKKGNDILWSIAEDSLNNVWIGTRNNGLYKYHKNDLGSKNYINYQHSPNVRSIPDNTIFHILVEKDNRLILSTGNGLCLFNPSDNTFEVFKHQKNEEKSLPNNIIINAFRDKWGYIWLGTMEGLTRFDRKTEEFVTFLTDETKPHSISGNFITHVTADNKGLLWIATTNGLNILDPQNTDFTRPESAIFKKYKASRKQKGAISDNYVTYCYQDSKNRMWICTSNGLCLYQPNNDGFEIFKTKDGLPSNNLYLIVEDNSNHLWLSSNRGLSKFDPEKRTFINYTVKNGLQSNEFNSGCGYKSKDGRIYFGGINGFNTFYPDSIVSKSIKPQITITKFLIFQQEVKINEKIRGRLILPQSISQTEEIILGYKENFFELEFAAMDFSHPEQNQYTYYLENFDESWSSLSTDNKARYTNVPPGEYIFHLRACNSDYVWNNEGVSLRIIITPPFWRTYTFYLISSIFFIVLIIVFIKYREYNLRVSKHKLEKEVRLRTIEIEEAKEEIKNYSDFIEAILKNANDGIVVFNHEGFTVTSNPAFEEITGYTKNELAGIKYLDLLPETSIKTVNYGISVLNRQEKVYLEYEHLNKNNDVFSVGVAATKMDVNGVPGYLAIIRDITLKKQQEQELENYRTDLEKLVKRRTKDLIEAKEKAERAERLKSSFLKNLSHEIRTPMNAIVGFSQLLENEPIDEKLKKYVKIVHQNSHQLLDLLDNIITLSKYEAEDLHSSDEKIVLKQLFSELYLKYNNLKESLNKKDIELKCGSARINEDFYIFCDKDKIKQIFIILLDNAFKFTESGIIEFGGEFDTDKKEMLFHVKDTGIGIPEEKLFEIFQTFTKVEDQQNMKLYRGVGLGLSLAKHITGTLKGEIWCESVIQKGSTFYFTIPCKA